MTACLSFTANRDRCYRRAFESAGLRSVSSALADGTVVHCWAPRSPDSAAPSLLLLHGFGANAKWQWAPYLRPLMNAGFNVYVPDLLFFGGSFTSQPHRSDSFQASTVMAAMEMIGVNHFAGIIGVSYGGFVGYRIAAMYPDAVDRLVLICAGVCIEESDLGAGLFVVSDLSEAASLLVARTPEKLMQLMRLTHHKPPRGIPSCFLADYIDVMCMDYAQEKIELINALIVDRKLTDLPKIAQPTFLIWGEHDQVFPLELAYRLERHLEENCQLVVIKKAGHAVNLEKPNEVCNHLKAFLTDLSGKGLNKHKGTRWRFTSRVASSFKRLASGRPLLSEEKA